MKIKLKRFVFILLPKCMHPSLTKNKIAFQRDAYRPLVDRIPACTAGGCLPGGDACPGGGACPVGGVYPSMQWGRQTRVKTQHSQTLFADGNKIFNCLLIDTLVYVFTFICIRSKDI